MESSLDIIEVYKGIQSIVSSTKLKHFAVFDSLSEMKRLAHESESSERRKVVQTH